MDRDPPRWGLSGYDAAKYTWHGEPIEQLTNTQLAEMSAEQERHNALMQLPKWCVVCDASIPGEPIVVRQETGMRWVLCSTVCLVERVRREAEQDSELIRQDWERTRAELAERAAAVDE